MLRSSICKKCTNNTFTIKAKCSASSKNIKIDVVTLTRITSRVEKAKYSCPAGASSYCNHMCVCVCVCVCLCHSVHWSINPSPLKNTIPLFLAKPPLNRKTVQAHLFRQSPISILVFVNPSP